MVSDYVPRYRNQSQYAYFIVYTPFFSTFTLLFCFISIWSGILILHMCRKNILKIDTTLQGMLSSVIVSDIVYAIALMWGCVYHLVVESAEQRDYQCLNEPLCVAQSFALTWSMLSGIFWCITIELFCFVVLRSQLRVIKIKRGWLWFLKVLCWGIPLVISSLALGMGALGETFSRTTAGYCWVKTCDDVLTPRAQFLWMLFAGKLWDILSYFSIVNIIVMFVFLQKRDAHTNPFLWSVEPKKTWDSDALCTDVESIPLESSTSESKRERRHRSTSDYGTIETRAEDPLLEDSDCESDENEVEREVVSSEASDDYLQGRRLFIWIPICLIITRIWGTVRFAFEIIDLSDAKLGEAVLEANAVLLFFQAFGDSSQAFSKLILVLLFRPEARRYLRNCCTTPPP